MEENRNDIEGRIRPRDPKVIGLTTTHMRIAPSDVVRRLLQLAFRDARTVIDVTYAGGNFWGEPLPPEIVLTTSNIDPAADTDAHLNFTDTGLPDGAYDVVIDPPHNPDAGVNSFIRARYGTAQGTDGLKQLIEDGARLGVIVKVQDQAHGGEFIEETEWVRHALGLPLYF